MHAYIQLGQISNFMVINFFFHCAYTLQDIYLNIFALPGTVKGFPILLQ